MKWNIWLALQAEIFAVAWDAVRSALMLTLAAFFFAAALLVNLSSALRRRQSRAKFKETPDA